MLPPPPHLWGSLGWENGWTSGVRHVWHQNAQPSATMLASPTDVTPTLCWACLVMKWALPPRLTQTPCICGWPILEFRVVRQGNSSRGINGQLAFRSGRRNTPAGTSRSVGPRAHATVVQEGRCHQTVGRAIPLVFWSRCAMLMAMANLYRK